MIKKVLLFAVTILGAVSCSKSDDNNFNGDRENPVTPIEKEIPEDKLIGVWLGTYEIVAEKPENQNRIIELLKERDEALKALGNKDFTKARAKFEKSTYNARFYYSDDSVIEAFDYKVKDNHLIDKETAQVKAIFTLEGGNRLIGELTDYQTDIIDTKAIAEHTLTGESTDFLSLKEKYTLKYKRKVTLTKSL